MYGVCPVFTLIMHLCKIQRRSCSVDHTYNSVNLWKSGGAIKCYILEAQPGTMLISCAQKNARHGWESGCDIIKCSKQYVSSFTAAINLVLITHHHHHHLIPHPPLVTACLLHAGEVTIFSQHTLCIKALSMIIES